MRQCGPRVCGDIKCMYDSLHFRHSLLTASLRDKKYYMFDKNITWAILSDLFSPICHYQTFSMYQKFFVAYQHSHKTVFLNTYGSSTYIQLPNMSVFTGYTIPRRVLDLLCEKL